MISKLLSMVKSNSVTVSSQGHSVLKAYCETKNSLDDSHNKFAELGDILTRTFTDKIQMDEKFKIYSRATHEAIIFLNFDGVVLDYNEAAANMVGLPYNEDSPFGKDQISLFDTVPDPEDRKKILRAIKNNFMGVSEYEIRAPGNGEFIRVQARGFNIEYNGQNIRVTTLKNITNLKKLENENTIIKKKLGILLVKHGYTDEESIKEALDVQEKMPRLLGEILLQMELISKSKLDLALERQRETQLGRILIKMDAITESQLEQALERQ